ncbi:MAG: NUDIX hydrolase [Chlamydiia bacterium]|nr:NUDIX hydrolase [Chlamydiia bacterium]
MSRPRVGAYGVALQDGKILLAQKTAGPLTGAWDLPGGGVEFGETPEQALAREFLEETAYVLESHQLIGTDSMHGISDRPYHFVGILYSVTVSGRDETVEPDEEARWVSLDALDAIQLTPFAKKGLSLLQLGSQVATMD